MAQSKGTIIRTFLFNSVEVRLVPWNGLDVHPETGIAFYVSSGIGHSVIGVQVLPNGTKRQINATFVCRHKDGTFHHDHQPRYHFRDAFGHHKVINVPRAVYLAWCGPIEEGMTIDHIDGCATNNDYRNLRCVSGAINSRDGAFLRKLKKVGIDPTTLQRWMILRYFKRMVKFKESHTKDEYKNLSEQQLKHILYDNN